MSVMKRGEDVVFLFQLEKSPSLKNLDHRIIGRSETWDFWIFISSRAVSKPTAPLPDPSRIPALIARAAAVLMMMACRVEPMEDQRPMRFKQ